MESSDTLHRIYVTENTGHAGKKLIHFGDAKADLDLRFWKSRYHAWFLRVDSWFPLCCVCFVPFLCADTNLIYVYNMLNGNQEQLFLRSILR